MSFTPTPDPPPLFLILSPRCSLEGACSSMLELFTSLIFPLGAKPKSYSEPAGSPYPSSATTWINPSHITILNSTSGQSICNGLMNSYFLQTIDWPINSPRHSPLMSWFESWVRPQHCLHSFCKYGEAQVISHWPHQPWTAHNFNSLHDTCYCVQHIH